MTALLELPPVTFTGERLSVVFDRFDNAAYQRFLQIKRLPESQVVFDSRTETYTVTAPQRFAGMLGVQAPASRASRLKLSPFLYDDQDAIVRMALEAKRFACWSWIGCGKTLTQLEFGRQVIDQTGGRFLIVTMNEIVPQTIQECQKFYGDSMPIVRLENREHLKQWCASGDGAHQLAITNYEKFNPSKTEGQTINEVRMLAGIAVDENKLKGGGAKQKWALIKSTKGVEFKLSCTATPAPNDTIEFASQASFLEQMRSDGEIIWTHFRRDEKTHRWDIKPHARADFFRFMAPWSIYVRDPRNYGWRMNHPDVPEPIIQLHDVSMTERQQVELQRLSIDASGQMSLFQANDANAIQRGKLSQLAKGFQYVKSDKSKYAVPCQSLKPDVVADLAYQRWKSGLQVMIWTGFNEETLIIVEACRRRGVPIESIQGSTKRKDRQRIIESFRCGHIPNLVARANMLGFGMNFQHVGAMILSFWNDSYESYVQLMGRAVRPGQTRRVLIDIPVIRELEGDQLENIFSKEGRHLAAVLEMEKNYIEARKGLCLA